MILLDTNHLTILQIRGSERGKQLILRIAQSTENLATTIISVEEQMRGWLASIAKERLPERQVHVYRQLQQLFARFATFEIAAFDEASVDRFIELQRLKVRIGTMDLKIAAIALASGALLLTANRRDFEKVPGLRFENWIDGD